MLGKEVRKNELEQQLSCTQVNIIAVDSYAQGVAFGEHKSRGEVPQLAIADEIIQFKGPQLRSRYMLERGHKSRELENQLRRLQRLGKLSQSVVCFGVTTDPFFPFEGKFDASMKALELFAEYTPGQLIVQTRSPLIVLAMPILKALREKLVVTIPIESHRQDLLDTYAPGLPRLDDRLGAIRALRACGIKVCIQAAPILPYGDWRNDVHEYSALVCENADYVKVKALWDGSKASERSIRLSSVGKRLVDARQFFYLRADSASPLMDSIIEKCPEKLTLPSLPPPPEQIGFKW